MNKTITLENISKYLSEGKTINEIAAIFNLELTTIEYAIQFINGKPKRNLSGIPENVLADLLSANLSSRDIAPLVGKGKSTVGYWINKYGLNDSMYYKKPEYNDPKMFNKIDSPEKAYIIGYTLADGYINEKNLAYGCALADKEILDFIAKQIGGAVREYHDTNLKTKTYPRARLDIGNKDIITDILKHGSAKEDKRMPIIPKHLNRFMIQGFFDGDGCITWGIRKDRNRVWQKINFSSSLKLLKSVQQILLKEVGISSTLSPKKDCDCYVLEFAAKADVLKFLDYIYPDDSFIILKRKYEKAQALRLELGEFGEGPLTPSKASSFKREEECVETNG